MKRRQFLTALSATAVTASISGCAGVNPFEKTKTPPTEKQLKYIEYYPYHQSNDGLNPVITISNAKKLALYPSSFGEYEAFEVYKVQPNGSGSKIGELVREEYQSESPPGHTRFSKSTVRGGTVLLIVCRDSNGEKYTYAAYAEIDGEVTAVAYNSDTQTTTTGS